MNLETALNEGRHLDVASALTDLAQRSAREEALLGIALLRAGRLGEAHAPLARAAEAGDLEAAVELGNWMRLSGRFAQGLEHFARLAPFLDGELAVRAQRWWGVLEYRVGRTEEGLRRARGAWEGYRLLGDELAAARTAQSLAVMSLHLGETRQARAMLAAAVDVLRGTPNAGPLVDALRSLAEVQMHDGLLTEALETLEEAEALVRSGGDPRRVAVLLAARANLLLLVGDHERYLQALLDLDGRVGALQDRDLRLWVTVRLAEHHSRLGRHELALRTVASSPPPGDDGPPIELTALRGVLARRRGDLLSAVGLLSDAVAGHEAAGRLPDLTRTRLQLAYAHYLRRDLPNAARELRAALGGLGDRSTRIELGPDVEELAELLQFASLEPDLAPLLDHVSGLAGAGASDLAAPATHLDLRSFALVGARRDGAPLHFHLEHCPAVLVYLALSPPRTRRDIERDLRLERGGDVGACLRELRDRLGPHVVVAEGPYREPAYRLGRGVSVHLDYNTLFQALATGDTARALAVYRGEFLQKLDGEWVGVKRAAAREALLCELRHELDLARARRDWARVVLLAGAGANIDPRDRTWPDARIEAARLVGSPAEIELYERERRALDN